MLLAVAYSAGVRVSDHSLPVSLSAGVALAVGGRPDSRLVVVARNMPRGVGVGLLELGCERVRVDIALQLGEELAGV